MKEFDILILGIEAAVLACRIRAARFVDPAKSCSKRSETDSAIAPYVEAALG